MFISFDDSRDSDPMASFGRSMMSDIYLLQIKTDCTQLDGVLYSLGHPNSPDAMPGATHKDVVTILRAIAETSQVYAEIATNLADAYERAHRVSPS